MNSIKELAGFIGRTGKWYIGGVRVGIEIIDVRKVWNRVDYRVKPVNGDGEVWVASTSVEIASPSLALAK